MMVLVLFLFTSAGIIVSKTGKTARLYHIIAAATAVVRRTWRNDRCWQYNGLAITIAVTVAITHTHAIVLAPAFSTATPQ